MGTGIGRQVFPRLCWAGAVASLALAVVWLAGDRRLARADAAPLSGLAGSDISPVQATGVSLVGETVLLELWRLSFGIADKPDLGEREHLGAKVTADFVLNNPETGAQAMTVGFPLYLSLTAMARDVGYYDLSNLRAFVNGGEVATQRIAVGGAEWAAWEMQFAPGDTQLRVTYDLPATEDACNAELGYLLHTGALWAGSIGAADVIVRFGYPAEDMFVSPQGGLYLGPTSPGYTVQDFDVRWHFENFEPDQSDDVAITFVTPSCWRNVLQARQALAAEDSLQNHWNLAKVLADIVFPHHGFDGPAIAQAADVQYREAIRFDPDNLELRAEYADFLSYQAGWALTEGQVQAGATFLTQIAPAAPATSTRQPASPLPEASATVAPAVTATLRPTEPESSATPAPTAIAALESTATPAAVSSSSGGAVGCLPGALPALTVIAGGLARRRRWRERR